jgi:glycosyltransferase involved in cell wall biosynthesis
VSELDVLMVTFDQPRYVQLALPRLLDSCGDRARVWLWHNGSDAETLEVSRSFAGDERVARFHHSAENRPLRDPINWLFEGSRATYVSKVDDDCLVGDGWVETLVGAHDDVPDFGVLGSWRFADDDFDPELSRPKIQEYGHGHRILRNFWVQGSGFVMKRECVTRHGAIQPQQSFPQYCIKLALDGGWVNGWYFPFVREEHMDDPRSVHTRFKTDADLQARLPLMADLNGISTIAEWEEQIRRSARTVQAASIDPRDYRGWRRTARNIGLRFKSLRGNRRHW